MSRPTIFALSTPPGTGAVAVVRVSGDDARRAVEAIAGPLPAPRQTTLRILRDPGSRAVIDQALLFWHQGPASFTGEDLVEIQTHGSVAVVRSLLAVLSTIPSLRLAEPGEFTRRAFLNGRMSLLEVEALADLVQANTLRQQQQAHFQLSGAAASVLERWQAALRRVLAHLETSLDFAEDVELADDVAATAIAGVSDLAREIGGHVDRSHGAEKVRTGFRVLLVGPTNVGKSSIFNRLVGSESAIVTAIPGTTRDLLRAELEIGGLPVTLIDSAGLRSSNDPIEIEGIRRTREEMQGADLILHISAPDVDEVMSLPNDSRTLRVWNKIDRGEPGPIDSIPVSSRTGAGFEVLLSTVAERLSSESGWGEPPVATRLRHREKLQRVLTELNRVEAGAESPELVAERLRACLDALDELMGKTTNEDILDLVFREFCIGK